MRKRSKELQPALVFEETTQVGEVRPRGHAEPAIWSERMLAALGNGVKGGKWFSLGDKAFSVKALDASFTKVKANKGACGVDGWTVERFDAHRDEILPKLHSDLMAGMYRPSPVKRVWIPKPGSKEMRPLGIPTVRDRVVQAALCHVLEPIFERDFAEHSYGFRPNRGCKDALRRVDDLLHHGQTWVVDADLKSYFDTIPPEKLLARVAGKVSHGRVLNLVQAYL